MNERRLKIINAARREGEGKSLKDSFSGKNTHTK